jgi:hypothetical protein
MCESKAKNLASFALYEQAQNRAWPSSEFSLQTGRTALAEADYLAIEATIVTQAVCPKW